MSVTTVNLGKIRVNWRGAFAGSTVYTVNDAVSYSGSSYICVTGYTSTSSFTTDLGAGYWQLMAQGASQNTTAGDITYRGGSGSDIRLPVGSSGQVLTVATGGLLDWEYPGNAGNDYYVSPNGSDTNDGKTLTRAFRTVRHACATITGPATLYIKAGTYYEQLPITVPPSISIIGDGMRDTIISPLVGNVTTTYTSAGSSGTTLKVASTVGIGIGMTITGTGFASSQTVTAVVDGVTLTISASPDTSPSGTLTFIYLSTDASPVPNQNSTMFLLSNETMLYGVLMIGMTGFTASGAHPTDFTQATVGGVFLRLNPASPISTKSPYIKDCTAKSVGGVGAIVDGSVHASGNRSMLFWAYNQVHDGGVGLVVCNLGKAEAVSCFTYYCYFGYFTYGGGIIRSLSGNNSYGIYGCVSQGYDSTESPVTATVYGNMLTFTQANSTGTFTQGELITQATSGATARVTSVQSGYLYYKQVSGTFDTTHLVTGGSSGATMTPTADTGQNNYLYVLSSVSTAPTVGASIQFSGDSSAYVIQGVSTATINLVPVTIVTLAQQKITASTDGTAVTIRYNFSNIRLTGHDFLSIGTGGVATTNYPGIPTQSANPANQTIWTFPGRIYYVATDQSGNFSVGQYFSVNQATGAATLNASAFNLSGLTSLRLGTIGAQLGAQVNEFSTDGTFSQNSDVKVPTQHAVTTYLGASYQNFSPAVDTVVTTATASSGTSITVNTTTGMVVNMTAVFGANMGNIVAGTVYYILTATGTTITISTVPGGAAFTVGTTTAQSVAVNTGFSLGDANHRWSHLYVGPGSITIGSLTLSDQAGTLQVQSSGNNAPANINAINNGTSNVTVANNGNITLTGGGNLGLTIDSSGNATFAGTVTVNGGATNLSTTNLNINDALIYMAQNNPANLNDIGLVGHFTSGVYQHTGIVRQASTNTWMFFSGDTTEPSGNTIVTTDGSFVLDPVKMGALTATTGSFSGAVAVNASGGLTTTQTGTVPIFNTSATGLNIGGAATSITMGASTGTFTHTNPTVNINSASGVYQINGTAVLNTTTLGSGITASSLTSVGTLSSLSVNGLTTASGGITTAGSTTGNNLKTANTAGGTVLGGAFSIAQSGGDYDHAGYNFTSTSTGGTYNYRVSDISAAIQYSSSGFTFKYAASGTAGQAITWTSIATLGTTGNFTVNGTLTSNSDARLKTNVQTITGALDKVLALRGVMYDRISTGKREIGQIAQETEAVVPELVFTDENGIKSIAYANTVALLIEAIKEQQVQINELKGKL